MSPSAECGHRHAGRAAQEATSSARQRQPGNVQPVAQRAAADLFMKGAPDVGVANGAHHARELAGDGEAQPGSAEPLCGRGIGQAELLEQLCLPYRPRK
jgi:hypothetical protein